MEVRDLDGDGIDDLVFCGQDLGVIFGSKEGPAAPVTIPVPVFPAIVGPDAGPDTCSLFVDVSGEEATLTAAYSHGVVQSVPVRDGLVHAPVSAWLVAPRNDLLLYSSTPLFAADLEGDGDTELATLLREPTGVEGGFDKYLVASTALAGGALGPEGAWKLDLPDNLFPLAGPGGQGAPLPSAVGALDGVKGDDVLYPNGLAIVGGTEGFGVLDLSKITASPVAANLDGKGEKEIVGFNAEGLVAARIEAGQAKTLATIACPDCVKNALPVPADVDGDGRDEIVVSLPAGARVFDWDKNGALVESGTVDAKASCSYGSAVGALDWDGKGRLEVGFQGCGALHLFTAPENGNVSDEESGTLELPGFVSASLVDLDGDKSNDLLWERIPDINSGPELVLYLSGDKFAADKGTAIPRPVGAFTGSALPPQLLEVDGIPHLEVADATFPLVDGQLPQYASAAVTYESRIIGDKQVAPLIHDLDGDGTLDVTFGDGRWTSVPKMGTHVREVAKESMGCPSGRLARAGGLIPEVAPLMVGVEGQNLDLYMYSAASKMCKPLHQHPTGLHPTDVLVADDGTVVLSGLDIDMKMDGEVQLEVERSTGRVVAVKYSLNESPSSGEPEIVATQVEIGNVPCAPRRVAAVDLDNDGSNEYLVLCVTKAQGATVLPNPGQWLASQVWIVSPAPNGQGGTEGIGSATALLALPLDAGSSMATGDLNADGKPDLVVGGRGGVIYWPGT